MTWIKELKADFNLDAAQTASLEKLLELLIAETDRNLTAVTSPDKIVDIHFRDSLFLSLFPETRASRKAVDVGSGAGFPGLPLAIALPDLSVSLIEARARKCEFIEKAIFAADITNAAVFSMRAEAAGRTGMRESFNVAFSRAVGSLGEVLEYCLPLLGIGGSALLQRGSRRAGDEEEAIHASEILGGKLGRIEQVSPYVGSKNLHIWVFRKTAATPESYPRRPGIARKRPLGKF